MSRRKYKKVKNKVSKNSKKHLILKIVLGLFLTCFFVGLTLAGAGLAYYTATIKNAPPLDPTITTPKKFTSYIYEEKTGDEIATIFSQENRKFVEFSKMPDHLKYSFVAIEDERFYEHNGVDFKGIARAAVKNLTSLSFKEGASTITQQLIKNTVFNSKEGFQKTLDRKIAEQHYAIELENHLSKNQILEKYLNTINLGYRIHGVQMAARTYFDKDADELTIAESAVLAAITKNPSAFNPARFPENNKIRQGIILKKLYEQEYISEEEYKIAKEEDVYSKVDVHKIEEQRLETRGYFTDEVISEVRKDLKERLGYSDNYAQELLFTGGLQIYTTLDTDIQEIVRKTYTDDSMFPEMRYNFLVNYKLSVINEDDEQNHYALNKYYKTFEDADYAIKEFRSLMTNDDERVLAETNIDAAIVPQPQASMVIIDYRNGHIKALVGGRGEKKISMGFNRATEALRQPGSTFKTLAVLAPGLDTKMLTAASVFDDVPFLFDKEKHGTDKELRNWYDNYNKYTYSHRGLTTLRQGIRDSINIVATKALLEIGIDTGFEYLEKFGFTSLVEGDKNGNTDKVAVLGLGGITEGVSTLELTAAYGTIANKGNYVKPILYTKVLDINGNILLDNRNTNQRSRTVLSEQASYITTDILRDVVNIGTGWRAKFKNKNMDIAGKTGTTNGAKDLLFVGYTPYYVGGVWSGFDNPKLHPNSGVISSGNTYYHKELWRAIMEEVHKDLPYKEFQEPREGLVKLEICTESGKLPIEDVCENDPRYQKFKNTGSTYLKEPAVQEELFIEGTEPTELCDVHVKASIDKTTGKFPTETSIPENIVEKIFIKRPTPYVPLSDEEKHKKKYILDAQFELPKIETQEEKDTKDTDENEKENKE